MSTVDIEITSSQKLEQKRVIHSMRHAFSSLCNKTNKKTFITRFARARKINSRLSNDQVQCTNLGSRIQLMKMLLSYLKISLYFHRERLNNRYRRICMDKIADKKIL